MDRLTRMLGQVNQKSSAVLSVSVPPTRAEGYDGDMGAYQDDGGIIFCVKAFSKWWELTSDDE